MSVFFQGVLRDGYVRAALTHRGQYLQVHINKYASDKYTFTTFTSQEAVEMMERILAWTGDRAGDLGRPELEGAGEVPRQSHKY